MKRLIQKQNAKQVGVLYHFTTTWGLNGILKSNSMQPSGGRYISLTRNKNFFDGSERMIGSHGQCRITIDGDRLSENYKVEPYNDFPYSWGRQKFLEQEERVKGYISPIIPYIIEITLFKDNMLETDIGEMKLSGCQDINEFKDYLQNNFGVQVSIV